MWRSTRWPIAFATSGTTHVTSPPPDSKRFREVDLDGEGAEAYDTEAPQYRNEGGARSHSLADDKTLSPPTSGFPKSLPGVCSRAVPASTSALSWMPSACQPSP